MAVSPTQWIPKTRDYIRETRSEMRKVTWPSRKEVVGTTGVVLIAVLFFGIYLWLCDYAILAGVKTFFRQFGVDIP